MGLQLLNKNCYKIRHTLTRQSNLTQYPGYQGVIAFAKQLFVANKVLHKSKLKQSKQTNKKNKNIRGSQNMLLHSATQSLSSATWVTVHICI